MILTDEGEEVFRVLVHADMEYECPQTRHMVSEHKGKGRHVRDEIVWHCEVKVYRKCAGLLQHVWQVGEVSEMLVSIEDDPSPQLRGAVRNRLKGATDTHHRS